ncbi:MAG: glycosyltransferase family 4 protein [Candidatus Hydrogenedentota bacterium]
MTQPIRVLMLNYEYPPLGGGAGNATHYLLREFAAFKDIELTLVTSSTSEHRVERPYNNITIYLLDIGKGTNLHYQTNRDLLLYSWKAWRFCRKLCKEEAFDVVFAFFGIPCGVIAYLLGKPYIISLRGSDVPGFSQRFAAVNRLLLREISRFIWERSRYTVANSEHLKQLARETSPNQPILVIPNGVDTNRFYPKATRGPDEVLRVLAVGRLIPRKGFDTLIKAARDLSDISVTIAGEGPEEDNLRALADGLEVHFAGVVPPEDMPELYRQHDVFVLPSANEGMSNAMLEALASGLPLVVGNTGDALRLVEDNGAVLPLPVTREGLSSCLQAMRDSSGALHEQSRASRRKAGRYSWRSVAQAYRGLFTH